MIKKISTLKDFGCYKDYSWNTLEAFKKTNLIYGWNYSGKTTLSKLFYILHTKNKNEYFEGASFSISTESDSISSAITHETLDHFPFDVRVFNTEYIKRIFTWDEPDNGFSPIRFYLGDAAGDLNTRIERLERKNIRLALIKEHRYQKHISTFTSYTKGRGKFSEKAKDIRENYLPNTLDQNELNKTRIESIANKVKPALSTYILGEDELHLVRSEAMAKNTYESLLNELRFIEELENLSKEVKRILEDTAPKAFNAPELDDHEVLFNWVQTGVELHKDATNCKFCTQELPKDRIQNLNSYYSEKLKEIQAAITDVQLKINIEKKKLEIRFPDIKSLAENYQNDFQNGINLFHEKAEKYKNQLNILEKDLERKGSGLFNSIVASDIEIISFKDDFHIIEKALKDHNTWLDEFDTRKNAAIIRILDHYIADYLQHEDYNQKEAMYNTATTAITDIDAMVSDNKRQIRQAESELRSEVKGQRELNTCLEILLHRDDIKIEVRDDKFTLERSGYPATDLSEGEKSAIAFSYFLTELKALRDDDPPKLPETVVFIDDPISSLDSNHIFQVRSLLMKFFRLQDFAQLFVSTHNFEFFSILNDSGIFSNTHTSVSTERGRSLYLIKRNKDGESSIEKMPKTFSKYNSEYAGIFNVLLEFHRNDDKESFSYTNLLPNALRRFVELYTLSKCPNSKLPVDRRIEIVFEPDENSSHNVKLLHWFSHLNNIERIQSHDDKLLQIASAIKDLIEHIETKDPWHWRGLTEHLESD